MVSQIDLSLFYLIYGLSGRNSWSDSVIVFIGEYLLYALLLLVLILLYRAWKAGHREKVWGYIAAVLSALIARFGVAEGIRLVYHIQRPFIALHLPHLLTDYSYSFPSGHVIFIFALATGIYRMNKSLGWSIYGVGLLIGLARVAGGVHYPSDILGGMILGIATGYIVVKSWKTLSKSIGLPST